MQLLEELDERLGLPLHPKVRLLEHGIDGELAVGGGTALDGYDQVVFGEDLADGRPRLHTQWHACKQ